MNHFHNQYQANGFTLVEVMIVIVIIGLLNAVAIPSFGRIYQKVQVTRIVNDLQTFQEAFDLYAVENGKWPNRAGFSIVPQGMSGYLKNDAWTSYLYDVGRWRWRVTGKNNRIKAFITLRYPGVRIREMMLKVDKIIDDGNLTTGKFKRNGLNYHFYLEEF